MRSTPKIFTEEVKILGLQQDTIHAIGETQAQPIPVEVHGVELLNKVVQYPQHVTANPAGPRTPGKHATYQTPTNDTRTSPCVHRHTSMAEKQRSTTELCHYWR